MYNSRGGRRSLTNLGLRLLQSIPVPLEHDCVAYCAVRNNNSLTFCPLRAAQNSKVKWRNMLRLSRSAEPGRKTAYSVDLRWRVICQSLTKELSFEAIAQNLSISRSTAYRFYALFKATGDVEPSCHQKKEVCFEKTGRTHCVICCRLTFGATNIIP